MPATFSIRSQGIIMGKPYDTSNISWMGVVKPVQADFRLVDASSTLKLFFIASLTPHGYKSSDGINFTFVSLPINAQPRGAIWAPQLNLWVTATQVNNAPNQIITSPDGNTWTPRGTGATSHDYQNVAWAPTIPLFVACAGGVAVQIATSPDGIVWTNRSGYEPAPLLNCSDIAWSPALGLFAITMQNGSGGEAQGIRIQTSPDGIAWVQRVTPLVNGKSTDWRSIAWSPSLGIFCAVGVPSSDNAGHQIMTSPDGVNWTTREPPSGCGASIIFDVVWSPERAIFVAVLGGNYPALNRKAIWSADGITWFTSRTPLTPDPTQNFIAVEWSAEIGMFLAIGSGTQASAIFMRSRTGK